MGRGVDGRHAGAECQQQSRQGGLGAQTAGTPSQSVHRPSPAVHPTNRAAVGPVRPTRRRSLAPPPDNRQRQARISPFPVRQNQAGDRWQAGVELA